jgi:hypothetical protein
MTVLVLRAYHPSQWCLVVSEGGMISISFSNKNGRAELLASETERRAFMFITDKKTLPRLN